MAKAPHAQRIPENPDKPHRFVFVLLDNFSLLCFSTAIESLRIANRMAGRPLYEWVLIGEGGVQAVCSAGTVFQLDHDLIDMTRDDTIMVCGGIDVQKATSKKVLSWLRREARKGLMIGGLCTAAYSLAKAGLLDGRRATTHHEVLHELAAVSPRITCVGDERYVDEGAVITCGGISCASRGGPLALSPTI